MKICFISDTHGEHAELVIPGCDVLIHCGDVTSLGKEHSVVEFLDWFKSLDQCKYKIFIAGNHDFLFERNSKRIKELMPDNVIYLENSGCEIDGVTFWGTPVTLPFRNWAFNRTGEQITKYWDKVPTGVDVLITHGPPANIMDLSPWGKNNIGSHTLYESVMNRIKPKIHCFGHLHDCHGVMDIDGIKFINASSLNEAYEIANEPILIELVTLSELNSILETK